ncbi:hypothetical protein EJ04DRAFT_107251 [Polyplosphaeria fusca]|uniref:Uncharacterized protein n=1 Tax=Polyplosphaeria fusca TaxID=682080 RepID=A0A9P4QMB6_9PLEO|nr:hypothetical protein EJ04DRAFT_107251 [Polyplosphaeria fusca]
MPGAAHLLFSPVWCVRPPVFHHCQPTPSPIEAAAAAAGALDLTTTASTCHPQLPDGTTDDCTVSLASSGGIELPSIAATSPEAGHRRYVLLLPLSHQTSATSRILTGRESGPPAAERRRPSCARASRSQERGSYALEGLCSLKRPASLLAPGVTTLLREI